MISESDIELNLVSHTAMKGQYSTLRRDDSLGIQMESFTNRDSAGFPKGKPKNYFFIDHDQREFHSIEDLIEAYNEKFKFSEENPDHEVVYVKVIRKRNFVSPLNE